MLYSIFSHRYSKVNHLDLSRSKAVTREKFRAWHRMVSSELREHNICLPENIINGDESAMTMKDNAKFVHTEAPYTLLASGMLILFKS
jgi:hypothetical protein